MPSVGNDVIGTGWKFPFQFDEKGRVATTIDQSDGSTSKQGQIDHIYGALYQLIKTAISERFMRTDLGCGIHDYIFEPNDETLVALVLYYVTDVVNQWEPRVEVVGIDAVPLPKEGVLKATITFRIVRDNTLANLVIPVVEST